MALWIVVSEALEAWREAEQLLVQLPPASVERESVATTLTRMRELYRSLTGEQANESADLVSSCQAAISEARAVLDAVRAEAGQAQRPIGTGTESSATP